MGVFDIFRGRDEAPRGLVGAAELIDVANVQQTQRLSQMDRTWQRRAWGYYDDVGEIHFAGRFIGSAISRIKLIGAESPSPEATEKRIPTPTSNKPVAEAVHKLRSEKGGQGALMRAIGLNIFMVGECLLIGIEAADGTQVWEGLSMDELLVRSGDKSLYRKKSPNSPPEKIPENALVVRCWQEHPRYSALPDSAMRSVLDECEKLLLITRADKAAARSRFAGSGLLFIPNELVPVVHQPTGDQDGPDETQNPVLTQLAKAMIEPIKDESHPSAVVPVVLFGPAEYGQHIKFTTFDREMDRMSASRWNEAVHRIATALDLPNEILTGKANLNHWTAWQIREETFQAHLQPFVELICDALTVGYLQPALKKAGVPDPEKYLVWYDDSELVVRPDRTELADRLYADNLISSASRLREAGFDESDAMPDDEYAKRVGILLKDAHLALTGEESAAPPPPAVGAPPDFSGNPQNQPSKASGDTQAADTNSGGKPGAAADASQASTNGQTQRKGPDPSNTGAKSPRPGSKAAKQDRKNRTGLTASAADPITEVGRRLAQLDIDLMMRLRTSADEVLATALARAGARIRGKAQANSTKDVIKDVPNELVASVLGASVVASLDLNDHNLMKGAFAAYSVKVNEWIRETQAQRARLVAQFAREHPDINTADGFTADDLESVYGQRDKGARELALAALVTGLMSLASRRLYAPDEPPPVNGEIDSIGVPASLVRRIVDIAGGSDSSTFSSDPTSGGIGTGSIAREMFGGIGMRSVGYEWVYGVMPRKSFQPHEDLDGLQFADLHDEALAVDEADAWLGTDYLHPGDHSGCLCSLAPIFAGIPDTPESLIDADASA